MLQKNQHRRSLTNVQYFKIIVKTVKNQNIINTNEHKQKKKHLVLIQINTHTHTSPSIYIHTILIKTKEHGGYFV